MDAGLTLKNSKRHDAWIMLPPPPPQKKNMPEHAIFFQNNLIKPNFHDYPSFSPQGPIVNQNFLYSDGELFNHR